MKLRGLIIVNIVYGQLGNQLFLFAHLLAHGMATNRRVWFPGFRKNENLFAYFIEDRKSWSKHLYLPFSANRLQAMAERAVRRLLHKDSKILRLVEAVTRRQFHVSLDFLTEHMYPEMEGGGQLTSPLCLFEGWAFRAPVAFRTFAPQLRAIFRFRDTDINHSKTFLKLLPLKMTIGVHIRQGDYAQVAPQWHYHPPQYHQWMSELRQEIGPHVGFVVVSDGKLPDFNENWIVVHRGSAIQDLCILSHCDMIMGAPSTFSRWAAFMGNKPHLCLWNEKQQISRQDFVVFKMLDDLHKSLAPSDVEILRWFGIV